MSKELEALESIKNHCKHYYDANLSGLGAYKIVEHALKRNEPMKPTKDGEHHRCPKCAHIVDNHYCSDCGQSLDWGKENE